MNIGIDIDDTISETFETLLPYSQKYTIEDLKKKIQIYSQMTVLITAKVLQKIVMQKFI